LRHLKQLLSLTAGRTLGVTELSQLSGRAEGTIENWLEGEPMQQVDFIFRLLERLPVRQQEEWWQNHVRLHPSLTHPRLAHDPLVAHQLQTLSAQPTGLTVIQAATMFPRAFLLMALGNSAWLTGARRVIGLDRHGLAHWAIPPQVQCVPAQMPAPFQKAWAEFRPPVGSLVLLGGLGLAWNTPELAHWARTAHVVITDHFTKPQPELLRALPGPRHWLTVTPVRDPAEALRVTIHAV